MIVIIIIIIIIIRVTPRFKGPNFGAGLHRKYLTSPMEDQKVW
jgi:hypothetical protein